MSTLPSERIAEEQAALRRVATLVARGAPPAEVFAAVAAEVGRVLDVESAGVSRYDSDGMVTFVGTWARSGRLQPMAVGTRLAHGGRNVITLVFETGRSARIEGYTDVSGAAGDVRRRSGIRAAVGVPISVEGRLWGAMLVASTREQPLPADTEARLAGFTELVATALANAQARMELRRFAEEQAALRRVATLVARAAPPEEVFAAVTAEVGRVLSVDLSVLSRYHPDGTQTVLGAWSSTGGVPVPVGTRVPLGGRNVTSWVFRTGRPARLDDYADVSGSVGDIARGVGIRSSVGVPVTVEGRLWGLMLVASTGEQPLPTDTEARLAGFTELVATALANAEAQAALAASRARIVAAADATRRRIERELHDGAQQHLVCLAVQLRTARAAVPPAAAARLDEVAAGLTGVLDELRAVGRGLHPAVLAQGGLRPALQALARRAAVPVRLDVRVDRRLPEPIENAAYHAVAEALANAAEHASATVVHVEADLQDGAADRAVLRVRVRDDGRGGADFAAGAGLVGVRDHVEALGGRIDLHSEPGAGTTVQIDLPVDDRNTTRPPGTGAREPADDRNDVRPPTAAAGNTSSRAATEDTAPPTSTLPGSNGVTPEARDGALDDSLGGVGTRH